MQRQSNFGALAASLKLSFHHSLRITALNKHCRAPCRQRIEVTPRVPSLEGQVSGTYCLFAVGAPQPVVPRRPCYRQSFNRYRNLNRSLSCRSYPYPAPGPRNAPSAAERQRKANIEGQAAETSVKANLPPAGLYPKPPASANAARFSKAPECFPSTRFQPSSSSGQQLFHHARRSPFLVLACSPSFTLLSSWLALQRPHTVHSAATPAGCRPRSRQLRRRCSHTRPRLRPRPWVDPAGSRCE